MTTREIAGFAAAYPELDGAAVDYDYLRAVSQDMVPFGRHVGTVITEIGPERAVVEIPAVDTVGNHMGTVHAGALFTAAGNGRGGGGGGGGGAPPPGPPPGGGG
ncbi:PaaI family thioesterase, partial [Nocardia brasiliensis]|uniref:PaaI family thioesterase n=1 Tax=Nocardia brasiliensis TaxID=37326 RepID=UPI002457FB23